MNQIPVSDISEITDLSTGFHNSTQILDLSVMLYSAQLEKTAVGRYPVSSGS